jgi:hypothetical protein
MILNLTPGTATPALPGLPILSSTEVMVTAVDVSVMPNTSHQGQRIRDSVESDTPNPCPKLALGRTFSSWLANSDERGAAPLKQNRMFFRSASYCFVAGCCKSMSDHRLLSRNECYLPCKAERPWAEQHFRVLLVNFQIKKKSSNTNRRWVILWRLTLSKKLGQPNLGVITTAIYFFRR